MFPSANCQRLRMESNQQRYAREQRAWWLAPALAAWLRLPWHTGCVCRLHEMGCGASHAALAHSPGAMPTDMAKFSRSRGLRLEPEREVEQLVNHVNLDKESLAWFSPQASHERAEWQLCFTFDAERPGCGAVYFGCGGPLAEAGDQTEIDPFLRRCEMRHEIAPAVRWRFEPGCGQQCTKSLSVQVRLPSPHPQHRLIQN